MKFFPRTAFYLVGLFCPIIVHSQIIDNRVLPPEQLLERAPFIPTDRAAVRNQNTDLFYVLDNADLITIQDYPDNKVSEVTMLGNVRIRFQQNYLRGEKVIITIKESSALNIAAYGSVEFTLDETKYLAESLNYQPKAERGILYDVRATLGTSLVEASTLPWFYRAEKASLQGEGRFVLENVVMSTSDARFDHFSIFAKRVWFLEGKIALAFGVQYRVGQASFVWLPAFMQMEGGGGITSSFGSDLSAGYYFINNLKIGSKAGDFNFGFDFYQRLGQYFKLQYTAPSVGALKEFSLDFDIANDTRVATNLPYRQFLANPQNERFVINQLAWHYRLSASVATNGFTMNFNSEHLNDPFFLRKYSYRNQFDNTESVDFFALINQGLPHFYNNYVGDLTPENETLAHSLNFTFGKLVINTRFDLGRLRNQTEENPFLNSAYLYRLRTMTLPSISLNPGSLTLASYDIKKDSLYQIVDSRGRRYTALPHEVDALINRITNQTVEKVTRIPVTNAEGAIEWNNITNREPVTITNNTTSAYTWFSLTSSLSGSFSFKGLLTFGSNIGGVNDPNNTNWRIVNDNYSHEEKGAINLNLAGLNNTITLGNTLDASFRGQHSSFNTDYTNNLSSTVFQMDYRLSAAVRSNFVWNDTDTTRVSMPVETSFSYNHPITRYNALDDLTVREGNLAWNTRLNWEFFQWRRTPILKIGGEVGLVERYRFLTDEQADRLDPLDPYFGNKLSQRLRIAADVSLWWLKVGTSAEIDTLLTRTNDTVPIFSTNRYTTDPMLNLSFTPDSTYHYIPSLTYQYLINSRRHSSLTVNWNLSFRNLQIPKLYPFIYEITEIGFVFRYNHNFITVRSSSLSLSFVFALKFTRYLSFRFTSSMANTQLHLYYGNQFLGIGETPKNFFQDLWDSLKIWDRDALLRTSFKLQGLTFELIHDLQTWDLRVYFTLGLRSDSIRQIAYWEPRIGIAFTMKGASAANIFPEFDRRFVPREFQ